MAPDPRVPCRPSSSNPPPSAPPGRPRSPPCPSERSHIVTGEYPRRQCAAPCAGGDGTLRTPSTADSRFSNPETHANGRSPLPARQRCKRGSQAGGPEPCTLFYSAGSVAVGERPHSPSLPHPGALPSSSSLSHSPDLGLSSWKSPSRCAGLLSAGVCARTRSSPTRSAGAAAHIQPSCARGAGGWWTSARASAGVTPFPRPSASMPSSASSAPSTSSLVTVKGASSWVRGVRGSNRALPKPLMRYMTVGRMLAGQPAPAFRKVRFPF
ncbi:hypothetical protein C8Q79DRAFT_258219 [Trametes meyenii]|nr:hypothetical protein C8Q79DRAFT_258219 [Trametes meyenii]